MIASERQEYLPFLFIATIYPVTEDAHRDTTKNPGDGFNRCFLTFLSISIYNRLVGYGQKRCRVIRVLHRRTRELPHIIKVYVGDHFNYHGRSGDLPGRCQAGYRSRK